MQDATLTHDLNGNLLAYLKNTDLKSSGQPIPYTKHQVEELIRCQKDVFYFAENYYKIVHQDHGMIQIQLRDYQKQALINFQEGRFNILKFPRQSGKSTIFEIFVCWYVLFNDLKTVALLADKAEQAEELLARIKLAYVNLPVWMQQGVTKWNEGQIKLENGSRVMAYSTSSTAIRGKAVSLLILDEVAFVPVNIFDAFWNSTYPTISSSNTSKVILVSTPNGMNHYSEMWFDAINGESFFKPLAIEWWDVPIYGCPGLQFDEYQAKDKIHLIDRTTNIGKDMSIEQARSLLVDNGNICTNDDDRYELGFDQSGIKDIYGIDKKTKHDGSTFYTPIQGYWRKETIANTSFRKFTQEFGGEFLASADSLISPEFLKNVDYKTPIGLEKTLLYKPLMRISGLLDKYIKIYHEPQEKHEYILGLDPAKITIKSAGDSLAMQIIDISVQPFVQVASVEIPTGIHYTDVHDIAALLGSYYNYAWIFIENNDQVGLLVADKLHRDVEYENIYSEKPGTFGYRTTKSTKKAGALRLKELFEKKKLILHDQKTISQLSTFIKAKDSYKAETGYKDDLVMAMLGCLFSMTDHTMFGDYIEQIDYYKSLREKKDNPLEEKLPDIDYDEDTDFAPMPFDLDPEDEIAQMSRDFMRELARHQ